MGVWHEEMEIEAFSPPPRGCFSLSRPCCASLRKAHGLLTPRCPGKNEDPEGMMPREEALVPPAGSAPSHWSRMEHSHEAGTG